jgi:hypothetical protein
MAEFARGDLEWCLLAGKESEGVTAAAALLGR